MKKGLLFFLIAVQLVIAPWALADVSMMMYPAFDEAFAKKMASLCAKADIILPNMTEASFMTGIEYKETYDEAYAKEMLKALAALGFFLPSMESNSHSSTPTVVDSPRLDISTPFSAAKRQDPIFLSFIADTFLNFLYLYCKRSK